jgi:hypothetical protein
MPHAMKRTAIVIGITIACWTILQRADSAPLGPTGPTWEYKAFTRNGIVQEIDLNDAGRDGWELVTLAVHGTDSTAVYKRAKH